MEFTSSEALESHQLHSTHNDSDADNDYHVNSPSSSEAWIAFQVLMMSVFCISGIFGNILTIVAVFKTNKLQTIPNYFIVNLAAADLIVCLLLEPFCIFTIIHKGCFLSQALCQMLAVATVTSMGASVLSMVIIAINRSINITKPLQIYEDLYTKKRTVWMCIAIWLVPLIFSLLFLLPMKFATLAYNPVILTCTLVPSGNTPNVLLIFNLVSLGICYSVVLICYMKIYNIVRLNRNRVCGLQNQQPSSSSTTDNPLQGDLCSRAKQIELHVAFNVLIIFILFLICMCPYMVVSSIGVSENLHPSVGALITMVAYANSSVNCIVYASRNKVYREAYYRILTRKCTSTT